MGPLAQLFSTTDSLKRRLVDALRNPRAALEQRIGQMNEDARAFNDMTYAAAAEPTLTGPASQALAMKLAESYNPIGMTKVVGPQAEALETARKNAVKMLGLPENNTPMDRARALGFDPSNEMYHATDRDFSYFIPSTKGKLGAGVYLSPNSKYAEKYVGENARVLPVLTRGNFASSDVKNEISDAVRKRLAQESPGFSVVDWKNQIDKEVMKRGYSGVDMEGYERTVFDPANIRSRFAAFDPAKIKESDLLGRADPRLLGLLGIGAGGAAYINKDSQQP